MKHPIALTAIGGVLLATTAMAQTSAPSTNAPSAAPSVQAAAPAPRGPMMYPDHGVIAMTKEQLTAAPAVTYASR